MAWDISGSDEFAAWFQALAAEERVSVARKVEVLAERGPALGRPEVDTVRGSKYPNMKELRVQHGGNDGHQPGRLPTRTTTLTRVLKLLFPSFVRTLTFPSEFPTARSGLPSPVRSPIVIELGCGPARKVRTGANESVSAG